ncbi:MAG: DUF1641 domain-containing protein [Deltaproteobacteria bacterium]|nr:DUF1641 domain-containing protein [Deltaproteobacteria bacterium]
MNKEELILERLDRIEAQLAPLAESFRAANELKEDTTPLANHAFQLMIKELEDVESSCQLEDLLELFKRLLRSVRSITYALNQLENLIDFITTLEPLLKSSVPQLINYLDELERKGVFRILNATLGVRAKIAAAYTPEDIEQIGNGLVSLLGLAKKMTEPQFMAFMETLADIPCQVDLSGAKEVGPFGFLWAMGDKEVKEGLGVLVELTKSMSKLKECGLKT